MGDILSSVLGTSTSTTQTQMPDPVQQQANRERLSQILALFRGGGLYQFGGGGGEAYQPTDFSSQLAGLAQGDIARPLDYSNLLSLDDYRRSFDPVTQSYINAVGGVDTRTAQGLTGNAADYATARSNTLGGINNALERSYGDYGTGATMANATYGRGTADINNAYNAAIARGDYDLARSISTNQAYADRALGTNADVFQGNLGLLDSSTSVGLGANEGNYLRSLGINQDVAGQALGRTDADLYRSLGIANTDAARSLDTQDYNRARALDLGIGATGNYIDQIATPRLNAALALQGLESGGAVPAAIARATAETAIPYLQSIENAYGSNQANTLNSLMGLKGSLTGQASAQDNATLNALMNLQSGLGGQKMSLDASQLQALLQARAQLAGQYAGLQSGVNTSLMGEQAGAVESAAQGNRALGGQLLGSQAALAGNYQNNVNQLAQALMSNNITLEQAGISAESALGQQLLQVQNTLRQQQQQGLTSLSSVYLPQAASFAQSLPGASTQLSMAPVQMQAGRAATLTGLQPLADFPRQLREADLLRRQGLFTSAFTGIPWQAGSTTFGGSATGNIFDQLGGTIQSGLKGGGNIGG